MRAFEGVYEAVVTELQHAPGAEVRLVLEVEVEAAEGFFDEDRGIVQDSAAQPQFNPTRTAFEWSAAGQSIGSRRRRAVDVSRTAVGPGDDARGVLRGAHRPREAAVGCDQPARHPLGQGARTQS